MIPYRKIRIVGPGGHRHNDFSSSPRVYIPTNMIDNVN